MPFTQPYVQLPQFNDPGPVPVELPGTVPPGAVPPGPIPPVGTLTSAPDWLAFLIAAGVVGVVAETIGNIDRKAGFMFVALVLMGYAAAGGKAQIVTDFLNQITTIASGNNSSGTGVNNG